MLNNVVKDCRATQVVSFISLFANFVLLTFVGTYIVWIVGKSRGKLENMKYSILTGISSALLCPLMLVVGLVRLVLLNMRKPDLYTTVSVKQFHGNGATDPLADSVVPVHSSADIES